jgi:hypothetical protein
MSNILNLLLIGPPCDELIEHGSTTIYISESAMVVARVSAMPKRGDPLICRRAWDRSEFPTMIMSAGKVPWSSISEHEQVHLWHVYGGPDPIKRRGDPEQEEEMIYRYELKLVTIEQMERKEPEVTHYQYSLWLKDDAGRSYLHQEAYNFTKRDQAICDGIDVYRDGHKRALPDSVTINTYSLVKEEVVDTREWIEAGDDDCLKMQAMEQWGEKRNPSSEKHS